jgi:WD40 repeat protein
MVRLWDPATVAALQTLRGHGKLVSAVAFSQDGKPLASASAEHTVRLWNPATGAALQTLEGHWRPVNAVAFGKPLMSTSGDGTVRLWDPATGAALQTLEDHGSWIRAVSSSPQQQSFGNIFVKGDWIIRDAENLLWLPFDYRAICSALHRNQLALGHASGQVIFIEFRSS